MKNLLGNIEKNEKLSKQQQKRYVRNGDFAQIWRYSIKLKSYFENQF